MRLVAIPSGFSFLSFFISSNFMRKLLVFYFPFPVCMNDFFSIEMYFSCDGWTSATVCHLFHARWLRVRFWLSVVYTLGVCSYTIQLLYYIMAHDTLAMRQFSTFFRVCVCVCVHRLFYFFSSLFLFNFVCV